MPTRFWFRLAEIFGTLFLLAILLAAWRADRRDRAKLAADLAIAKQSLQQADARQHARDAQLAQTLSAIAAEKRSAATASPTQILRALPKQIPLPSPITLQPTSPSFMECGGLAAALTTDPNHPISPRATKQPVDCRGLVYPELRRVYPELRRVYPEPRRAAALTTDPNHATSPHAPQQPAAGNSSIPDQLILPAADLKPLYDYTLDCQACQAKLSTAQSDLTDERAKSTILTRERDEAIRAAKGGSLLRRITRNAKWLLIGAAAGAIAAKSHP